MRQVALILALTVPLAGCGWLSNSFAFVGDAFGFGAGGEGLPFRATAAGGRPARPRRVGPGAVRRWRSTTCAKARAFR
jgi:hypothetical protein